MRIKTTTSWQNIGKRVSAQPFSNDNIFGLLVRGVRDKCGVLVIGAFRIICLNQAKQVQQKGCKGR